MFKRKLLIHTLIHIYIYIYIFKKQLDSSQKIKNMKLDIIKLEIIKWASGPSIDEKCYIHNIFITLLQ